MKELNPMHCGAWVETSTGIIAKFTGLFDGFGGRFLTMDGELISEDWEETRPLPCDMCDYKQGGLCYHPLFCSGIDEILSSMAHWHYVIEKQGGACYLAKPKEAGK